MASTPPPEGRTLLAGRYRPRGCCCAAGNYSFVTIADVDTTFRETTPNCPATVALKWCSTEETEKVNALRSEWNAFRHLRNQGPGEAVVDGRPHFTADGHRQSGIIGAYEYFEEAGNAYLALEHAECDLMNFLQTQGRLSEAQGRQLMSELLQALAFIHEAGYAHRDLKPHNILVVCDEPPQFPQDQQQHQQGDEDAPPTPMRPSQVDEESMQSPLPSVEYGSSFAGEAGTHHQQQPQLVVEHPPQEPLVSVNFRLADFGLARRVGVFPRCNSAGDYDFLSPEVREAVDQRGLVRPEDYLRNDSYAAGLTMLYLVTGKIDRTVISKLNSTEKVTELEASYRQANELTWSDAALDLLRQLLAHRSHFRPHPIEALAHDWLCCDAGPTVAAAPPPTPEAAQNDSNHHTNHTASGRSLAAQFIHPSFRSNSSSLPPSPGAALGRRQHTCSSSGDEVIEGRSDSQLLPEAAFDEVLTEGKQRADNANPPGTPEDSVSLANSQFIIGGAN